MKTFHSFRSFDGVTLFVGLALLAFMAGCVHVDVASTCSPCCEKDGRVGACNPMDYTSSANGFWNTENPSQQYQGGGNCAAGSKKCAIPAGRCANGQACKSWVTPSTMVCKCDCNP
jgi:hypothetical protein